MPTKNKPLTVTIHADHASIACFDKHGAIRAETKVSLSDLELIQQSDTLWSITGDGYAIAGRGSNGRQYLHRLLMNPPKGMEVDHINRDRLDNRRENLRVVTHRENMQNQGPEGRGKSGYRGVYQTRSGRWFARKDGRYLPGSLSDTALAAFTLLQRARGEA